MKILGVDPGSRAAGWALVSFHGAPRLVGAGVLRPATTTSFADRLLALHDALLDVVEREKPDEAAVEKVFSGVNPQSLITLGEARGVLLLALARAHVPVHEITPAEIKKTITGTGQADKEQVRRMVLSLLGSPSGFSRLALDAADAAAAALTHGFQTAAGRRATLASTAPSPVRRRVGG
ncbi:MAG: crossover junction endodeoxyribonuclease RuvC [Deltaproteobacteria bacterium]|nr:crossover junction endodeoxyribonuclease RuvC [Deltaproteobacteria bacterium]